jgi:16S rRNA (cytosine1402-N4)-methyltransferase
VNQPDHQPVLREEAVDALQVRPDGNYVDATYGRGGHSKKILEQLNQNGQLLILDRDPVAIAAARQDLGNDTRVIIRKGPFSMLEQVILEKGLEGKIDGILFDLGVSSPQLDSAERGFSFQSAGPLDMRMDTENGQTAAQWLADVDEKTLVRVLKVYGEERFARRIARAILAWRVNTPIDTTEQLAKLISDAVPTREPGKHPATRSFQAIRIFINDELGEIERTLPQTVRLLAPHGRLVVISFHSLEDRIVKNFMREASRGDPFPIDLPVTHDRIKPLMKTVGKKIKPSAAEVEINPRSRSAVLRVAERTEVAYG